MFEPKPHTIVRSIVQRSLLKCWEDCRRGRIAPARTDIEPEQLARCSQDIAIFEILGSGPHIAFKFRFQGANITAIYGGDWVGRRLDDVIPEALQPTIMAGHRAAVALRCPIYTERPAVDANGVPLTFERLVLPFSSDGMHIDHVLSHLQMFCPDGRYQRHGIFFAAMTYREHTIRAALTTAPVPAG